MKNVEKVVQIETVNRANCCWLLALTSTGEIYIKDQQGPREDPPTKWVKIEGPLNQ